MVDFGLTAKGFKRKTYIDIQEDMEARARNLFGEDVNLSEKSPLGLYIRTNAWEISKLWEEAEKIYFSAYIDTAEGVSLSHVGKYIGTNKKGKVEAIGKIKITGTVGTRIPTGFLCSTTNEIFFQTMGDVIITNVGYVIVNIKAIEPGKIGNVSANSITEIVKPIPGVESITNLEPTQDGREVEDDYEFRERYDRSVSMGGSSTRESVEASLLSMDTIKDALVEENDTMQENNGIPPKSLAPFVYGGDDTEVAKTILNAKAGGIRSYGTTEIIVLDSKGRSHLIGFTRPTIKETYVKVTITKNEKYPSNGDDLIKTNIIKYIGGIDSDGTNYKGLGLGRDVIVSKIIFEVSKISGVDDVNIEVSVDGQTYSSLNILVSNKEVANTSPDKVLIL
ncbi:Uncharacterized phage protein gp47/JayE [Desulfonispora thiosulfatigenes DSM 11270]|uniref:Uncharacterized phage protein gp47/JayE n=1 Tax=Desulfonispora thiosulfatigenes DSM 11270 TaxID=656914 RepID=A0A1W1VPN7_DESTI|nr:baseplate J/gp47 family protein [Desulfonispora thiosulfatigenes]SMB95319.1 Uncharacterized phage protein gp47/JayE [Desulfonispora thiosulfatigenes DSM 11270]